MTDFRVNHRNGRYLIRPLTAAARSWLNRERPDLTRTDGTIRTDVRDAAEIVVSITVQGMSTRSDDPELATTLAGVTAVARRLVEAIVPRVEAAAEGEDPDGPWKRWLRDVRLLLNPRK